jgi:dihydroorotase
MSDTPVYRERLRAISPDITYLMTLYLHSSLTPEIVREAKKAGIVGIKV